MRDWAGVEGEHQIGKDGKIEGREWGWRLLLVHLFLNKVERWSRWSRASSLPPFSCLQHWENSAITLAYYRITRRSLRSQVWKGINMVAVDTCPDVGPGLGFRWPCMWKSILEMCGVGHCQYTFHEPDGGHKDGLGEKAIEERWKFSILLISETVE